MRGRRSRTTRQITAVASAALVVAAAAGAVTVLPPPHNESAPAGATATPPPLPSRSPALNDKTHRDLAVLPDAGQPGAATRPDLVGTDPAVLHFSADTLAEDATVASWLSEPGTESVQVVRGDLDIRLTLARSAGQLPASITDTLSAPADIRVGARPATVRVAAGLSAPPRDGDWNLYLIDWQPVDGLWARAEVQMREQDAAVTAIEHVRLDQSRRLTLPFSTGTPPAGATERGRGVDLRMDTPGATPGLTVTAVTRLTVGGRGLSVQGGTPQGREWPDTGRINAGPYRVYTPDNSFYGVESGGQSLGVLTRPLEDPLPREDVLAFIAGFEFADLNDPSTWR